MATTSIIPLHPGRDEKISKALKRIIDYVENPAKTNSGDLVIGYECDPHTAAGEFALDKRAYIRRTGRTRGADDIIAYHVRQAFLPGEITPEAANQMGLELAKRFTNGNHAFIVATHTDRHHIHNHIIINAINLDCNRKLKDEWNSSEKLQRLSDRLCMEQGYSVVEQPKHHGKKYNKWEGERHKRSQRDELREAIDIALIQRPDNLGSLLKLLVEMGWEIKRGKHLSLRKAGQQRFKRMDSLGDDYSEGALAAICKGNRRHTPKRNFRGLSRQNERLVMLSDIQSRMHQGRGPGYERWSKVFYLKQMAQTMLYLSENDLDYDSLIKQSEAASQQTNTLLQQINNNDKHMKEISELKRHIINYFNTREVYAAYRKAGYSKKFVSAHEDDLRRHKAAKEYFDHLGTKKLPSVKTLNAELQSLKDENAQLYTKYKQVRDQMQQSLAAKANLELILHMETRTREKRLAQENTR